MSSPRALAQLLTADRLGALTPLDPPAVPRGAAGVRGGTGGGSAAEAAGPSPYDEGVQAGLAMARAEAAAEREHARERLERAAAALAEAADQLREARAHRAQVEVGDAAALALELVETLVAHLPADLTLERIRAALRLVPDDDVPVLRLNPEDEEAVSDLNVEAKVVSDPSVEPGGCVVEAGPTRIDAQRGPALRRLRQVLGGER